VSKNNTGSLPLRGILPVKTQKFTTTCKVDHVYITQLKLQK